MSIALKRIVWLLIYLLISLFSIIFIQHDRLLLAVTIIVSIMLAVFSWVRLGRVKITAVSSIDLEDVFNKLPSLNYRQPIIISCQSQVSEIFHLDDSVRYTDHGCYVFINKMNEIDSFVEELLIQRPSWRSQLTLLLLIAAETHKDKQVLMGVLNEFYYQHHRVKKLVRSNIPTLILSCLNGQKSPWFEITPLRQKLTVWENGQTPVFYKDWIANGRGEEQKNRIFQILQVNSWIQWFYEIVIREYTSDKLDHFYDVPVSVGITFTAMSVTDNNLWEEWVRHHLTLPKISASSQEDMTVSFPDFMCRLLPHQSGYSPVIRAVIYVMGSILAFLGCSFLGSYFNNRHLLQSVSHDIATYYETPSSKEDLKKQAFYQLQNDKNLLDKYYRHGVPLRLDFQLYPGEQLYPPLLHAINSYDPPKSVEKPVPVKIVTQNVIHFNSMSLFDIGKSVLKAGSTKILVDALLQIKAKPGWLIFISGHTDSTGSEALNQKLSRERAEAVQNWMIQNSDIPSSCFAIQGFGSSQPVADNSTREGRAANRRVDVRLIPDKTACLTTSRKSDGTHPSPSTR